MQLLFDPTDEATGTQLDATADPYSVDSIEAPAPAADFSTAGNMDTEGDAVAARRHQNRRVGVTVDVVAATAAARDSALDTLAEKVAKIYRQGGTLRLVKSTGAYRTLDLLAADGYEPQFDVKWALGQAARVTIGLLAAPYARGVEASVATFTETSSPAAIFETSAVAGDVPARGRLVLGEDQNVIQQTVWWALQNRYYDAANTHEKLFYGAEELRSTALTSGHSTVTTGAAGASGAATNNIIRHSIPGNVGVGDVGAAIGFPAGGGAVDYFEHVGTFRVLLRAYTPTSNTLEPSVSLVWSPYLESSSFVRNAPVTIPDSFEGSWSLLDLGMIKLPAERRASKWVGQLQALAYDGSGATTTVVDYDALFFLPVAEGWGVAAGAGSGGSALPNSTQSELAYDGWWRDIPDGGRPDRYQGDYLFLPPGVSRLIVKNSRGEYVNEAAMTGDAGVDDISGTLYATPRYLSFA